MEKFRKPGKVAKIHCLKHTKYRNIANNTVRTPKYSRKEHTHRKKKKKKKQVGFTQVQGQETHRGFQVLKVSLFLYALRFDNYSSFICTFQHVYQGKDLLNTLHSFL